MILIWPIIYCIIYLTSSKIFTETIPFSKFEREGNWVFLSKMILKKGESVVTFESQINGIPSPDIDSIVFSIIKDKNWNQFLLQRKCQNNNSNDLQIVYSFKEKIPSVSKIIIAEESTYYFVLKDCKYKLSTQSQKNSLYLNIKLTIINHDSHLSCDQDHWAIYPISFALCVLCLIFLRNSRKNNQEYYYIKILILMGIWSQISAIILKAITYLLIAVYGYEFFILDFFYLICHTFSSTVFMSIIILIAYGWTINYQDSDYFDLYLPLICMLGFLNVVVATLNKINDGDHDKYHMYDTIPAKILIGFRVFVLIVYIVGLIITYNSTHAKKQFFIVNFGIIGFIYIISLPLSVYITDYFIDLNNQRQFMFITTQIVQVLIVIYFTYMAVRKNSSYKQVSYQNTSFIQNQKLF